jgi:hypothetical protein
MANLAGIPSYLQAGQFQKATGRPELFGYEQFLHPGQLETLGRISPSIIESALGEGLSPTERSRMLTRGTEDIERSATGALKGLEETTARTGLRGGVQKGDIGDIFEAKVGATGRLAGDIETQNIAQKRANLERAMKFGTTALPGMIGQRTDSEAGNIFAEQLLKSSPLTEGNLLNPFGGGIPGLTGGFPGLGGGGGFPGLPGFGGGGGGGFIGLPGLGGGGGGFNPLNPFGGGGGKKKNPLFPF